MKLADFFDRTTIALKFQDGQEDVPRFLLKHLPFIIHEDPHREYELSDFLQEDFFFVLSNTLLFVQEKEPDHWSVECWERYWKLAHYLHAPLTGRFGRVMVGGAREINQPAEILRIITRYTMDWRRNVRCAMFQELMETSLHQLRGGVSLSFFMELLPVLSGETAVLLWERLSDEEKLQIVDYTAPWLKTGCVLINGTYSNLTNPGFGFMGKVVVEVTDTGMYRVHQLRCEINKWLISKGCTWLKSKLDDHPHVLRDYYLPYQETEFKDHEHAAKLKLDIWELKRIEDRQTVVEARMTKDWTGFCNPRELVDQRGVVFAQQPKHFMSPTELWNQTFVTSRYYPISALVKLSDEIVMVEYRDGDRTIMNVKSLVRMKYTDDFQFPHRPLELTKEEINFVFRGTRS